MGCDLPDLRFGGANSGGKYEPRLLEFRKPSSLRQLSQRMFRRSSDQVRPISAYSVSKKERGLEDGTHVVKIGFG